MENIPTIHTLIDHSLLSHNIQIMTLCASFALTNAAPTPQAVRVVTVVNGAIVMDIPQPLLKEIVKFVVQILATGQEQRTSKRQTVEPITFTVENTQQPWVNIPTNKLTKGSTYTVQVSESLVHEINMSLVNKVILVTVCLIIILLLVTDQISAQKRHTRRVWLTLRI